MARLEKKIHIQMKPLRGEKIKLKGIRVGSDAHCFLSLRIPI